MLLNLFGTGREAMSSIDTAWLRMDRPTNLMVITGLMLFEGHVDFARLQQVLEKRFLQHNRFRQRVVKVGSNAYWENDDDFDIANHLHLVALPGKAGRAELEVMVNDLISTPLDFGKPLWQFYLVENYHGPDGPSSVLVSRIHHCIADGIALIQVLLGMTDKEADGDHAAAPKKSRLAMAEDDDADDLFLRLYKPVAKAYSGMLKSYFKVLGTSYGLMTNPAKLAELTQTGLGVTQGVAKLVAMPADPKTKFKGKLGTAKRIAWSDSLPLDEVKHVGKVLGCSINDVLLACVAGALRGYLLQRGQSIAPDMQIRASVPVNLRPESKAGKLGNHFGLVFLSLPIGIANPIERVYEVSRRMEELKKSYDAFIVLGLLSVVGMLPDALEQPAVDYFSTKSSAVMTNVPGPREQIYLAGKKVDNLQFWVPQSGEIGLGVSILSYNGGVNFGIMTDKKLAPDPGAIIARFQSEFEKVVLATLMQDWNGPPDSEMAALAIGMWAKFGLVPRSA